jgi:hypothetical protein
VLATAIRPPHVTWVVCWNTAAGMQQQQGVHCRLAAVASATWRLLCSGLGASSGVCTHVPAVMHGLCRMCLLLFMSVPYEQPCWQVGVAPPCDSAVMTPPLPFRVPQFLCSTAVIVLMRGCSGLPGQFVCRGAQGHIPFCRRPLCMCCLAHCLV